MSKVQISIDRGGTFCDVWASIPGKGQIIFKLLSEDPSNYQDAPTEGIRRVLELFANTKIDKGTKLNGDLIEWVKMGTTIATNALLERKGEKFVFVTTQGFQDVLKIGNQSRPELFNLKIVKPEILYDDVVEIDERITVETSSDDPNQVVVDVNSDNSIRLTPSGTIIRIIKPLDVETTRQKLLKIYERGYSSIAICLAHSYLHDDHEQKIYEIAKEIGFKYISISSQISKNINFLQRGNSTCIDAYLTPHIQKYVDRFLSSFINIPRVEFMQSNGGLTSATTFRGINAILSGPAGGVVGVAKTCYNEKPVICFDMGGTSTDVSRIQGLKFDISFENKTAGIENSAPQLNINTVAAGGGSILKWENGLFHVGPESAGAHPGPACYRKGGPLTVTDANLFLGRLDVSKFPNIFGPNGDQPLDGDISSKKFAEITEIINKDTGKKLTPFQVAIGFLRVANETMARSIREITEARGFVTKSHTLVSFGGAGSQNCSDVARNLDINQVLIHKYSSVLSAYGIAVADVAYDLKEPFIKEFTQSSLKDAMVVINSLKEKVVSNLCAKQSVAKETIEFIITLGMKYKSSNTVLQVEATSGLENYLENFLTIHKREFGFNLPSSTIIFINSIQVKGVSMSKSIGESNQEKVNTPEDLVPVFSKKKSIYFDDGPHDANVYELSDLKRNTAIRGPALLIDDTQTILVNPHSTASITKDHVIIELHKLSGGSKYVKDDEITNDTPISQNDPILTTIFSHRFMSIAETMGRTLQKTSISTSIKERLDFSCAIFDADGGLVANAPHIPVHLGSMQYAIQYQHNLWNGKLKPGDVLVSNHPEAGGTHLPDITVITPVFHEGEIVFYVASRGHHADVGGAGITAMAPNSKELWQEGVSIKSFKLVSEGVFNESGIIELFNEPAKYPGCSATRKINDNLSDLKAQISANQKGIGLVEDLFVEYGKTFIQYYMKAIRHTAEIAVRNFFKQQYIRSGGKPLEAVDYFDDGTKVQLKLTIDGEKGEGFFDFTGTGPETYGPMNTPEAITHSCVIYVLRCLIDLNIPLNQGCLTPCKIHIPKNSILNPSGFVAICGSTISGQRVTDVLLKAFDVCAASQGCANSFGWGTGGKDPYTGEVKPGFATGEAIGGGVGAGFFNGVGYDGESCCNVHCTNTRITDIEVVESRTPVIISKWEIRKGSGGRGKWNGGDGAIREIEARIPLRVSILSERRIYSPYGLKGGEPGAKGLNLWFRKQRDGGYITTRISGKEIINVLPGDRVQINTPGGGGYGVYQE